VFSALQYQDAAKYIVDSAQSLVFSEAVMSKRWFDGLPANLKTAVMEAANKTTAESIPWGIDFVAAQRKSWVEKGGEIIPLPAAEKAELMAKMRPVGDDIVKTKPELKGLHDLLVATARRTQ
jgi:TRAP-type C4-dicarboxylate transport system substrate-binding protein